ncbi:PBSX family phage portal protein [Sphingomonas kyeonggiensis]|uniref:phage portal protein n=1 Tax=Sphingomonas kyeonggiensis TaxID=1268553 RepID=UPI00277D9503|nr:phage portal protein [Sphingomonas kyeonggiensis]MDQ0250981.1 PBSX family phage portal protein [Sphingomonas kyeonggiensis]
MSPHHRSAIIFKRNQLLRHFVPLDRFGNPVEDYIDDDGIKRKGSGLAPLLDRRNFGELALNLLQMGNCYLERRDSMLGTPLVLVNSPAIHTRRGVEEGAFWWVPGYKLETPFAAGAVFHLYEAELTQEIYGLPEWTSAMQSGLLNADATVFRRKYYQNGSHMGYILYVSEETLSDEDGDAIEAAMDEAKGPGNFRNFFLHLPGGKEKGVQVIPVGEATAKDEFMGIKNATRGDILTAHRVPPVLIGVVPEVNGGFGKPSEAADAFHFAEIEPLQLRFLEVNAWLGLEAVRFRRYERQAAPAAAAA